MTCNVAGTVWNRGGESGRRGGVQRKGGHYHQTAKAASQCRQHCTGEQNSLFDRLLAKAATWMTILKEHKKPVEMAHVPQINL